MNKAIRAIKSLFAEQQPKITFSGASGAQIKSDDLIQTEEAQKQLMAFEKFFKTGDK